MKKKIITIVASSLGVILISALLAAGLFFLIRNKNVEETGNVLGISWYNEEEKEIEIKTAEQLNEFAQLSKFYDFEGQTVKLVADIVMNEGNAVDWAKNAPKTRWMPIQQFKGIFDGQGHTISGLYGKGYGSPMALFAKTDKSATVKNLSLVNSYFQTGGSGGAASFAVDGEGKFLKLYSDAIIVNKGEYSAGIVVRVSMNAVLEECWFDGSITQIGRYLGGVLAVANTGRVSIKHCLFSGSITTTQGLIYYASTDGVRTGGICGSVNANATLMVEDSLASGSITLDEKHTVYSGSVIGAIFNGGSANATDTYTTVKITGRDTIGSGSGRSESLPVYMKPEEMTGYKAYEWTTLDFDNYWAVVEDGTPVLQEFAEEIPSLAGHEKAYDISWYNPNVYEVTITDVKQLYGLAVLSKSKSFEGVVFRLGNDIVVNEGKAETWMKDPSKAPTQSWMPIGTNTVHFKGIFDGQGHSISGLYYNAGGEAVTYVGLFGMTGIGSTIQNLKITNSYFDVSGNKEQRYVGAVAGTARGIVDTVYSDIIIKADGRDIGGIVGYLNYSGDLGFSKPYVSNCWFNGKLFGDTGRRMGGITGAVFGVADNIPTYNISNCLVTGTIGNKRVPNSGDGLGGQYIGGILGQEANPCNIILKDCLMAGTLELEYPTYAGSVIGRLATKQSTLTYDNVYATSESFKQTTNGTSGTAVGAPIVLPEEMLTGVKGYQWTTLDFEKYWTVAKNDTPVLQSFADFAKVPASSIAKVKRMVNTAWYKADAKEMTINTLEELYGFWLMSNSTTFEGQTIKLGKDIAVNAADASIISAWKAGTSKAANPWFPIGSRDMQFKGSFDGQMHTISGIYLDTYLSKEYLGLFGYTGLGSTIKNLKITNSLYDVDGDTDVRYVGSFAGCNRGNLDTLYSDVQIVADGQDIGGIVGYINFHTAKEQYVLHNLWFNGNISGDKGRRMGGIVGVIYGNEKDTPTYKFDNCLNTGTISNKRVPNSGDGLGGQCIGGLLGKEANQTNVIFKDCMNAGTLDLAYHTYAGNLIGRPENPNTIYTMDNVYMITDAFSAPYNDRKATIDGHIFQFSEKMLSGEGGYQWTALDFNKYWAAVKNDTPVLKSFLKDTGYASLDISKVTKMMDTKWYDANPKAEQFEIDTREELYGLWSLVARGISFKGKEIVLTADVAVNTVETFQDGTTTIDKWKAGTEATYPWFAIGSSGAPFEGTFNGKDHTISGICINDDNAGGNQGIFAFLGKEGTIKNLKATDSLYQVKGDKTLQYIGGIVAYAQGSLLDLYSDVDIVTDGTRLGGIVGYLDYTGETNGRKVKNCWFNGRISGSKARQSGGIVGVVLGHDTKDAVYNISNCLFTGYLGNDRVPQSGDGCGGQYIGGILGQDTNTAVINISDSVVAGTVYSKYATYLGSVVGRICTAATEDKEATVLDVEQVYVAKETYTGATIGENIGVLEGTFQSVSKSTLYGYGALMNTALDFEGGQWSAVVSEMPIPTELLINTHQVATFDTEWYYNATKDENDNLPGSKNNPYKIGEVDELYGLAKLVNFEGEDFAGKTIVLTADIPVNIGDLDVDGVSEWTSITSFAGTFNGKGNTISGIKLTSGSGIFAKVTGKVQNFKLSNSVFDVSVHGSGSIVGTLDGELKDIFADDTVAVKSVKNARQHIGGLVGTVKPTTRTAKISNCSFAGTVESANANGGHGGIVGTVDTGNCEITNCEMSGTVSGAGYVGGIIGFKRNAGTTILEDSLVTGSVSGPVEKPKYAGSIVGAHTGTQAMYIENVYTLGKNLTNTQSELVGIVGIGTQWKSAVAYGLTEKVNVADITGNKAWEKLNLDFYSTYNTDGVWVVTNGLPKLNIAKLETDTVLSTDGTIKMTKQFGWYYLHTKKTAGETTADVTPADGTIFKLQTMGDLKGFMNVVDTNLDSFAKDEVQLCNSIAFNPAWDGTVANATSQTTINWTGIGSGATNFQGTFNGNNHTISKVYQNRAGNYGGLFRILNGTVKNLTITDSIFSSRNYGGSVAGTILDGKIENVHITNTVSLTVQGDSTSGYAHHGGIVGHVKSGSSEIKNCSFAGSLTGGGRPYGHGGIVGTVDANCTITECTFTGTVSSPRSVGGIIGKVRNNSPVVEVKNCVISGTLTITESSGRVASITGATYAGSTVKYSNINDSDCQIIKVNSKITTKKFGNVEGSLIDLDATNN